MAEYPIAFVEIRPGEDDGAPWLLLESILSSEEVFARVSSEELKMTKWALGRDDEETLDRLAGKYRRNPKKLSQLYHRVAANNVRYVQDDVTGYGIWPVLSRVNHSCDPNARVCAAKDRPLVELLLSVRPITEGTAICWNYLSDPAFLELGWFDRNARLYRDFRFLCRCPRCESERPASVNDIAKDDLAAFFSRR